MATTISSTFDLDRDGWTVSGDAQGNSVIPNYFPAGGVSGGYASATDDVTGGTWYWQAPTKFLGNIASSYGLKLSFSLKQSDLSSPFDNSDVILQGGGLKLTYQLPRHPGLDWTAYEVGLGESGWVNSSAGRAATQAEMKTALGAASALFIRGEYRTGADTGGIDSVVLQTSPANQTEIFGTPNNDVLSGTQASETFWGLAGIDTVNFSSPRSSHTVTNNGSSLSVTGPNGSDQLFEVERLSFTGANFAFDLGEGQNATKALGFIGVVAPSLMPAVDIRGLIVSIFDQGMTMEALSQVALDVGLLPKATNALLANAVFNNLFGVPATPEITSLLVNYMDSHSQANFVAAVADLHINVDLVGLQTTGMEYIL